MKLASLRRGGRDGTLIVVDQALQTAVLARDIAPTLRHALEHWDDCVTPLEALAASLAAGDAPGAFEFEANELASPLPRSFQFLDGSVYLSHMEKARKARNAAMPPDHDTVPLMYQGLSDPFLGPGEDARFSDASLEIDLEAEIAVITDDVPAGVTASEAGRHIKLIMLLNDWTLRGLTRAEVPRGFGFIQSKPASACSPVAVTPAEFGAAWDGRRLDVTLTTTINDQPFGQLRAGEDMYFDYAELIAHAARTRALTAGTIIGAGTVSNRNADAGHGCIAEARMDETLADGEARTPFLNDGDRVRIEVLDSTGASVCGAISQQVVVA